MADPVTLLAFANDQEGHRYLRDLPEESRQLQAIFEAARRKGLCELVVRPNATLREVFDAFTEYKDRVAIFHYGGHAGSDRLFLESPGTDGAVTHAAGLARFLGQRRNLELVFLNGCSTRAQAFGLLDAGIGAVISTARAIEDKVAREFAASFYAEIAAGATLLAAYEAARGRVQAAHGSVPRAYSRTRDMAAPSASTGEAEAEPTDERGFPWELRFAPGAELERRWSLPEAAGNPLFGLPAPRVDCLPETPYRGLQPFTRRETAVFFGRSRAIRELYNLVTDPGTRPVILYYGPTGVGKSSVLAAGLLPRLELGHEVLYLRRDSNLDLLRTLRMGLAPGDRMDQPSTASELAELWRACERPDRPLVVVLDQAEEAFTHPAMGSHGRGPDSELEDLLEAVRVTFTGVDPARRPRGKLILGFRNDWLDRFQQAFNRIKLGWEPMPLKPLDHDGIIEVIEGPARDPALKRHYQLTIAPGLAPVIANDLLGDTGSALAPTLQFLLTKMWTRANVTDGPSFDQDLYRALQHEGYQLGDMLQEGLKAVSEEIRESGLALDVLEFHTTEFDTAARRSRAELDERYPHRKQELDNLLRTLEEKYLLIETEGRGEPSASRVAATRLAHDTLAPVVRREFQESTAPGQRARRL
ncbi:MAG: nSTAND1 domain-containing NTPase, partial [Isosphaeraceae bacterium]